MHGSIWCVFIFNERKCNYFDSYEKCFCIKRNKLSCLLHSKIREKKWGNDTMPSPSLSLHSFILTSPVKQKASSIKSLHGTLLNPPSAGPTFPSSFCSQLKRGSVLPTDQSLHLSQDLTPSSLWSAFKSSMARPPSLHPASPTIPSLPSPTSPSIPNHIPEPPILKQELCLFYSFFFGHTPWLVGSWFPDQGLNPEKVLNPNH